MRLETSHCKRVYESVLYLILVGVFSVLIIVHIFMMCYEMHLMSNEVEEKLCWRNNQELNCCRQFGFWKDLRRYHRFYKNHCQTDP